MQHARSLPVVAVIIGLAAPGSAQVTFELSADRLTSPAASVAVVGSFNDWDASANPMALADGKWSESVALPDGQHRYKFVCTDAAGATHAVNDPANPYLTDDGKKGANNVVEVAGGARVPLTGEFERFEWEAPDAKWVTVTGDFNDWEMRQFHLTPQGDGVWVAYLPVKRPFAYKFIIDNRWRCDAEDRALLVPNGLGGYNSFRPAAETTLPSAVTITRAVLAGDEGELAQIKSLVDARDYGRAVALARKVAEVNEAADGSTVPLVLKALAEEGIIHRRWNRLEDAAACWKRLVDTNMNTTETFRALNELVAYHLFVTKDLETGRRLSELAIARAPNNLELIRALNRNLRSVYQERRFGDVVAMIDALIPQLPLLEGQSDLYAHELAELWLTKGLSHYFQKQWNEARTALETCIRVDPGEDSDMIQKARAWLRGVDRQTIRPRQ